MKSEYTSVIPVRVGSRRLKNKNIFPFGESNLLIHKIRQLKLAPKIDQIVVSSDSPEVLEMAKGEGISIYAGGGIKVVNFYFTNTYRTQSK